MIPVFLHTRRLLRLKLKTNASADVSEAAVGKDTRNFSSKVNATAAMFAVQASLENALGDKPAAKKSVDAALSLDPNNKTALYLKAGSAITEGDMVLADELTKSLEKLDAGTESVKVLRARYLIAANKTSGSRTAFENYIGALGMKRLTCFADLDLKRAITRNSRKGVGQQSKRSVDPWKIVLARPGQRCLIKHLTIVGKRLDIQPSNIDLAIGFGARLLAGQEI